MNGWFAFALLRGWKLSAPAAVGGALMVQPLPFVAQEMGVLQLTAIFGILWLLFFLQQFLTDPNTAHGIAFAARIPIVFFACGYYGLFSLIFVPPAVWIVIPAKPHLRWQLAGFALAAVLVAAVLESLALPLALHPVPPIDTAQPWQQWINRRAGTPRIVLLPSNAPLRAAVEKYLPPVYTDPENRVTIFQMP